VNLNSPGDVLNWREVKTVLVADAHSMGSVAVIRSLGSAGYRVITFSARKTALGFYSRYSFLGLQAPDYADANIFISWLKKVIKQYSVSAIIPSEAMLLAIHESFAEFSDLLPVSHDQDLVFSGMSKFDLFHKFLEKQAPDELRKNLPPSVLLQKGAGISLPWEGVPCGAKLYAKLDAIYSRRNKSAIMTFCNDNNSTSNLTEILENICPKILLQGHVEGVGVGVFFLRWNGRVLASFMHKRLHEVPHTGGASSYRCAWWHDEIYDDALRRLEFIDWQGVAMFEYRWEATSNAFYLMELNARFWGSLHLALYAGVDFPRLLMDAFFGFPEKTAPQKLSNVKCRWTFPREVEYVRSCLKDGHLPIRRKAWVVAEFLLLGLDPRIKSDLFFPGDRRLFFVSIPQALQHFLK